MADRWYFTRERIRNCPSVRDGGIDCAKELGYRQQCANFIQDIGQRLSVSQLCINTSIVYMHRFYMFHSFKQFHRNTMAPCFIFLGAKVEEQPRKLEHVLKVAHRCLHKDSDAQLDVHSDEYMQMAQDLIDNESILLQTLGFDLSVEHPHTYVVKCAQMVKAAKELAQTSYFLATNSLHLTTFCIEEKPTVVACVCIFVACKWTSYEIPESHDKKHWWEYMDSNTTIEKIKEMSSYFITILDSCPTRLKKKISTGPVIYKGGAIQPKKEADGEHSKTDKLMDSNANKTNDRVEGISRNSGHSQDRHLETHSKRQEHQSDTKKDLNESNNLKKPSKHPNQVENDRKSTEHHKHHKRKHNDHGKHQGERTRQQDAIIKRPEEGKNDKTSSTDSKPTSSASYKPTDISKQKAPQSEPLSSAAKHILSLPPLYHKHSLPDTEKSMASESPAKKQRVEGSHPKKHRPDGEGNKTAGQADVASNMSSSSSHKKLKSSSEKHKSRSSNEKHSEMLKHAQQTSDKSSYSHKHYSNVHEKHSKEKKHEHFKSSTSRSTEGIEKYSSKSKPENTSSPFKVGDDSIRQLNESSGQSSKQGSIPKKQSSNEKKAHKTANSTPKKNGHSSQVTSKTDSISKESSLPPPPPPPSFNVPNILTTQPPLPAEPEVKQKPAPPSNASYNESTSLQQKYGLSAGQTQSAALQTQMQGQLYSLQHQVIPNQQNPSLISQGYQQQSYIQNPQSVASTQNSFTTQPLYYQGQQDSLAATSDVSQAYWPSINTSNLFSPPNIALVPQPPVPPQGLVIHQVDGLPPPPPLNLPPFPPPPT